MLDAIWPDANVTDNALTQAVSELRRVLGDDPSNPRFIKTVARRGYRFTAPIDAAETASAAVVQQARAVSAVASAPAPITPVQEPPSAARGIAVLDFFNVTGDPETAASGARSDFVYSSIVGVPSGPQPRKPAVAI